MKEEGRRKKEGGFMFLKATLNREQAIVKALDEDLNPVQRNRPTHDGAPDPLVGQELG